MMMSLRKKVEEKSAITTAAVAEKQFAWMISAKSKVNYMESEIEAEEKTMS